MFFGLFLLALIIVFVIITIVMIFFSSKRNKAQTFYRIIAFWVALLLFFLFAYLGRIFRSKKVLDKEDFYGEYIIDRDYFSGIESDWQYNHYRFEIKENDSIYFYVTDNRRIIKTYKGKISTVSPYKSARLKIDMKSPTHHILSSNPTIYREPWDFFLVFNSPKYHNMYFRKGEWEEID